MNSKGMNGNMPKAVQYSLILTMELDYNSKEEKLFNECTDSVVRADPKRYCINEIASLSDFEIWTKTEIDNMCAAASTQVILDCSDGVCTPCADEISFMFIRYADFLDSETTRLYQ
jgi:hypothetical protein